MNSIVIIGAIVVIVVLVIAIRWDRKRKRELGEWTERGKEASKRISGEED